ncbi:MAG: hypothetical protein C0501_28040 [Isosphaera sp.]|nr:hypothetical protein [Isosphaera sp.]
MTATDRADLLRLLSALCDGRLAAADRARLDALLCGDPEARQVYRRYVGLHVDLGRVLRAADPAPPAPVRRRWGAAGLAAAAVVAAGVLLAVAFRPPPGDAPGPAPVGRVAEVDGAARLVSADGRSVPAAAGQPVFPGQTLAVGGDDGGAVVESADASVRLRVYADTAVRLSADGGGAYLSAGTVRAEVGGTPFILTTPHAEVRSREASRFTSSADGGGTWVSLEDGRGDLVRSADGAALALEPGRVAEASAGPGPLASRLLPVAAAAPRAALKSASEAVAVSPDGRTLASATGRGAELWDAAALTPRVTLRTAQRSIGRVAFAPDGRVAVGGAAPLAEVWDPAAGVPVAAVDGGGGKARSLAFAAGGRLLATVGWPGPAAGLRVWGADTGRERPVPFDGRDVVAVAAAPDGAVLVAGTRAGRLILWDPAADAAPVVVAGDGTAADAVAVGRGRVAQTAGRRVLVRDLARPDGFAALDGAGGPLRSVAVSPDGRLVAAGSADGLALVWDAAAGRLRHALRAGDHAVQSVAFLPGGRSLVTVSSNKAARVWDLPPAADH